MHGNLPIGRMYICLDFTVMVPKQHFSEYFIPKELGRNTSSKPHPDGLNQKTLAVEPSKLCLETLSKTFPRVTKCEESRPQPLSMRPPTLTPTFTEHLLPVKEGAR